jgi:hypothetical protein
MKKNEDVSKKEHNILEKTANFLKQINLPMLKVDCLFITNV